MAVEDISYAVEKLLEELATNSPNLTTSDFSAIRLAIAEDWRLAAVPPETEYVMGYGKEHYEGIGTNIVPTGKYRVGQDQVEDVTVLKEMMEKSLQDQGGEEDG